MWVNEHLGAFRRANPNRLRATSTPIGTQILIIWSTKLLILPWGVSEIHTFVLCPYMGKRGLSLFSIFHIAVCEESHELGASRTQIPKSNWICQSRSGNAQTSFLAMLFTVYSIFRALDFSNYAWKLSWPYFCRLCEKNRMTFGRGWTV